VHCHMILEGIHIPKAMGVHCDQGLACDLDVTWRGPWTWSGVIRTDQCSLGSPRRGRWSKPRGDDVGMNKVT